MIDRIGGWILIGSAIFMLAAFCSTAAVQQLL